MSPESIERDVDGRSKRPEEKTISIHDLCNAPQAEAAGLCEPYTKIRSRVSVRVTRGLAEAPEYAISKRAANCNCFNGIDRMTATASGSNRGR